MRGHSRNPGYIPGDHWVECAVCGFEYRSSVMRERWDNLIVCPDDWESRHPQDFVRVKEDDQAAQGLVNPPTDPNYTGCSTGSSIAGIAVVGCAIVGYEDRIPSGTFTI